MQVDEITAFWTLNKFASLFKELCGVYYQKTARGQNATL